MTQRNSTPRHGARGASQRGGRPHAQTTRAPRGAHGGTRAQTSRPSVRNQARPSRYSAPASRGKAKRANAHPTTVKSSLGSATFTPGPSSSLGSNARPSAASKAPDAKITIPLPEGESLSITRRQLLMGAVGVGVVAVVGVAGAALSSEKKAEGTVDALAVDKNAVFSTADCSVAETAPLTLAGEYKLPYGSLVWANSDTYAACLLPTENSSPLTQAAVLTLATGEYSVALSGPASKERGFDIYDVRCNEQGIVWVESNCFSGEWRVYAATLSRGTAGNATLVDSGDSNWDIPYITVANGRAFWQVMPTSNGNASTSASALKSAAFGSSDVRVDWESDGRFSTAPYSTGDAVCISPRSEASSSYSQLTLIDAESGAMRESLTLPASMRPLEAAYVNGRFSFTFDSIYTYGEGLASLGTYAPTSTNTGGEWFCFDRNPLCAPAWCGGNLIVKSTRAVAGIDLGTREMFSLDCPDDCDNYGDFLASQGDVNSLVTYLGMSSDEDNKYTLVRVWKA